MIDIIYNFDKLDVKIKGHGGDKYGEDIYCAGVSALTMALACALTDAARQGLIRTKGLTIKMEDGDSHLRAKPTLEGEPIVRTIFTTIFNGYDALSVSFPEKISFKPL